MDTTGDPLVAMLDELSNLGDLSASERASRLLERLDAGNLRVALVGEAKRGKSTFGNALLGQDVLPTGVVPVTAISTEVCAGSPRRAEISFGGGSMCRTEISQLDRFVSERVNSHNHLHVRRVRVYLPDGMPHQRMVLVDTPGVGSVHQHNTEAAQDAYTAMDAAVFVLTADPPISASELGLLRDVAALAVRVFVVLNKADQLEPDELAEAADFVADVAAEALGERPKLWICSARQGLRARLAGDEAAWRASGMDDFLGSLLAHLIEHREADLRASIAASALRIAAQQLDALAVTLAAVEALEADQKGRLEEFSLRLNAVDRRRTEALEFVTTHLRQERRRLDDDATREIHRAGAQVRQRLETWLASSDGLPPVELEKGGRDVIAQSTRAEVETWREAWHRGCQEAYVRLVERQQRLLDEASGDLRAAAHELFGVRLASEAPALTSPDPGDLQYDFGPEIGWNHALVSGVRTHAPMGIGRGRVSRYLREEASRMVDKHFGRARAGFQDLLEDASRRFSKQVADAFAELTDGLRRAQQAAVELPREAEPGHGGKHERLAARRHDLEGLTDALGALATPPTARSHTGQRSAQPCRLHGASRSRRAVCEEFQRIPRSFPSR